MFIFLFALISTVSRGQLPNTTIKNLISGSKISFDKAIEKDKITIVSIWATWCAPCKKEIKNIAGKLPSWKKEAEINFVTISIDESRAEGMARTYALSQGWDFPSYIDINADLKRSLNFQSCPFSLIINKEGKVIYSHIGYEEGVENELFEKAKALK